MKNRINEVKVSYHQKTKAAFWHKINSSQDAANILHEQWDKSSIEMHESFKIILLNNGNKVKGIYELSKGGITAAIVDIRMLFAVVLKSLSVAIILCHNHPSGTLKPSVADKTLTKKIKSAAELLDIAVLDHIIITPNDGYYSFADEGIL